MVKITENMAAEGDCGFRSFLFLLGAAVVALCSLLGALGKSLPFRMHSEICELYSKPPLFADLRTLAGISTAHSMEYMYGIIAYWVCRLYICEYIQGIHNIVYICND